MWFDLRIPEGLSFHVNTDPSFSHSHDCPAAMTGKLEEVGVEKINSDCPTHATYERMMANIYYSAELVIHSSSIFHPRIPRIPICHLREPSISTPPLGVSNDDSPNLPSIVTLIVPGIAAPGLIAYNPSF
jgi:hypothetical protein